MNMGIGHWALAMWRAWDFLPFHLKRIKLCFIPSCLQSLILNPKMPAHFNDNVMMTTTPCSVSWEVLFCAARAKALHQTGWLIFHKMSMCVISISESSFDNLLVSTKLKKPCVLSDIPHVLRVQMTCICHIISEQNASKTEKDCCYGFKVRG